MVAHFFLTVFGTDYYWTFSVNKPMLAALKIIANICFCDFIERKRIDQ